MRQLPLVTRLVLFGFGALPLLSWAGEVLGIGPEGSAFASAWFELQCHAKRLRSFALLGAQLPVCARCLGIYVGLALGAAFGRAGPRGSTLMLALAAGAATMLADVASETMGLRGPSALLRALTGLAFGVPAALLIVHSARTLATPEPRAAR